MGELLSGAAEQTAANPPGWLSIVLAVIAGVVAVAVALAPAVIERVKRSKAAESGPTVPTPAADASIDLVGKAFDDLRAERDEAQAARDRLADELSKALRDSASKDVELARHEARIERLQNELDRRRGVS